jgi:hypothetical protein
LDCFGKRLNLLSAGNRIAVEAIALHALSSKPAATNAGKLQFEFSVTYCRPVILPGHIGLIQAGTGAVLPQRLLPRRCIFKSNIRSLMVTEANYERASRI